MDVGRKVRRGAARRAGRFETAEQRGAAPAEESLAVTLLCGGFRRARISGGAHAGDHASSVKSSTTTDEGGGTHG